MGRTELAQLVAGEGWSGIAVLLAQLSDIATQDGADNETEQQAEAKHAFALALAKAAQLADIYAVCTGE